MCPSETPVRIFVCAARRSAPFLLFGAAFVQWLGIARTRTKNAPRECPSASLPGVGSPPRSRGGVPPDPAIHAELPLAKFAVGHCLRRFSMDRRVKPGGDEDEDHAARIRARIFHHPLKG